MCETCFTTCRIRLKFVKSARAESAAIGDYIARLILSVPQIAVHYVNGGKSVYRSTGNGTSKGPCYFPSTA